MGHIQITRLFVVLFLFSLPVLCSAGPDRIVKPALQVSVFDDAHVPPTVLTQAEARASVVLAEAGIRVQWLSCSAPAGPARDQFRPPSLCSSIAFPAHLSVRLLSAIPAVFEDTFGQSFLDESGKGAYSNVYYQRIAGFGGDSLRDGDLLGYVFAHEIGHLLLGPNSHSPTGIMCARWSSDQLRLASRGLVFFTPSQADSLRARLAGSATAVSASARGIALRL